MASEDPIESIIVSAHALTRFAARLTGNDAPAAQWRALSVLDREGAKRVGELARAARTTQPGMTRLVGQMTDQALVSRTADPEDSRASTIAITATGESALSDWRRQLRASLSPLFADLDTDDRAAIARVARVLEERIAATSEVAR